MDPQSIISIIQGLLFFVVLLVFVNLYLVVRLKEIDPFKSWNRDLLNGGLFMVFFISGLVVATISMVKWYPKMILIHTPASFHGVELDSMMWNTIYVTFLVVIVTNGLLFYFSWKYRAKEGNRATYYPHNNKLEYLWTGVPFVVMFLLVLKGGIVWWDITMGEPESDEVQIEVTGKQFAWTYRYPSPSMTNNEFGETNVGFIKPGINDLGFNIKDSKGFDDIVVAGTEVIYFPVNTSINLQIRSQDVLHSATLAHMRVKMDAVPGMPTSFRFKPMLTTAQMKEKMGEDFEFEMSCQQICGGGHWNMKRIYKVVSKEEYAAWLKSKTAFIPTNRAALGISEEDFDMHMAALEEGKETLSMNE